MSNVVVVVPDPIAVPETFYAAANGSASNAGTADYPWSLAFAVSRLGPGDTLILRGGTYTDPPAPTIDGTQAAPITIKAYPGERVIFDGPFSHAVDWYVFKGIEFMYSGWTTRVTAEAGSYPSDMPVKDANLRGENNQFIGCIFHDLSRMIWYTVGGEMHDCLSFFNGWRGPDRGHGHGYYIKNGTIAKRMVNCLAFDNWGCGIDHYSDNALTLDNMAFEQCVAFSTGRMPTGGGDDTNLLIGGEAGVSCDTITLRRCHTFDGLPVRVGVRSGATNVTLIDNIFPEGIDKFEASIISESGNDYGAGGYIDYTRVYASEKIAGQANIIVCNQIAQADSVTVDVSAVLNAGDTYTLRNVRDYFVDVVTGTVGSDGMITIDMRAVSHSIATPVASNPVPNGFPMWGAFVLQKP